MSSLLFSRLLLPRCFIPSGIWIPFVHSPELLGNRAGQLLFHDPINQTKRFSRVLSLELRSGDRGSILGFFLRSPSPLSL
jgi:hypothetical protein